MTSSAAGRLSAWAPRTRQGKKRVERIIVNTSQNSIRFTLFTSFPDESARYLITAPRVARNRYRLYVVLLRFGFTRARTSSVITVRPCIVKASRSR